MENHFTLSWDQHRNSISSGLALLQQSGEFVDMTLAADGHFVKVHQLVMSLCSPYIKDLIKSAQSQNPIIFLNKISYSTLKHILEYIYTGEVVVAQNDIKELIDAGQALHIKGLIDIGKDIFKPQTSQVNNNVTIESVPFVTQYENQVTNDSQEESRVSCNEYTYQETLDEDMDSKYVSEEVDDKAVKVRVTKRNGLEKIGGVRQRSDQPSLQYSVSNQGGLQLILNRYIYNLRYTSRNETSGTCRKWICDRYRAIKCRATVMTKNNVIVQRNLAHTHPFNDHLILKKVQNNAIFSAIADAEHSAKIKKQKSNVNEENK